MRNGKAILQTYPRQSANLVRHARHLARIRDLDRFKAIRSAALILGRFRSKTSHTHEHSFDCH